MNKDKFTKHTIPTENTSRVEAEEQLTQHINKEEVIPFIKEYWYPTK